MYQLTARCASCSGYLRVESYRLHRPAIPSVTTGAITAAAVALVYLLNAAGVTLESLVPLVAAMSAPLTIPTLACACPRTGYAGNLRIPHCPSPASPRPGLRDIRM